MDAKPSRGEMGQGLLDLAGRNAYPEVLPGGAPALGAVTYNMQRSSASPAHQARYRCFVSSQSGL